ncbi:MAG: hypothetical protein R8K20_00020 [Gallionellaceae bacterium]
MKTLPTEVGFRTIIRGMRLLLASFIFVLTMSSPSFADNDEGKNAGNSFRQAAIEYAHKADKYRNKGYSDIAKIYTRLAEIKRNAGKLADESKWEELDWTEYEKLKARVEELIAKKKN